MAIQVSIVKGYYRNEVVSGIFPLVKPYKEGARGGTVTIRNPAPKPNAPPIQRITVEIGDFTLLDDAGNVLEDHVVIETAEKGGVIEATTNYEQVFANSETDDEAMERIASTFAMLDRLTDATSKGHIRGMVVSGPPGIGKSFGVEKQLETANMFRTVGGLDPLYEVISGGVSSIGLYQKLYHNKRKENVLVFDDSDGVLFEEECLNLLKAALNSGDKRRICWNKESRVLVGDGIPDAFDFEGGIIFLTNVDFVRTIEKGSRISSHLAAIVDRCHYLDLEIGSMRDRILRIKQVCRDGMLAPYDFKGTEEDEIIDFVVTNAEYIRNVSLRVVKKVADFVKTDPTSWRELAEATVLTKEAKFKRLVEKRRAAEKLGVVMLEA